MAAEADPAVGDLSGINPGSRRLLVVDDHAMIQMGLRALLGGQEWVQRCLSASSSAEALDLSARYEPHVALVDLFIGHEYGVELCRALRAQRPEVAVLLMSGTGRVSPVVARSAGAVGFVPKNWSPEKVVRAVKIAAVGKRVRSTERPSTHTANLTAREMQVLQQIASGASNPEAARALHLSPHTIKQYTSSLYRKLDAQNRTDAVVRAQRLGLVY